METRRNGRRQSASHFLFRLRLPTAVACLVWTLCRSTHGFSVHHSAPPPLLRTPPPSDQLIRLGKSQLQELYEFELDDWQLQAGGAIYSDYNVVVCAPTGAGKTVVGEMALHKCCQEAGKAGIYTTPLKALSNEKYRDLSKLFGRSNTGLSTGDVSINRGAKVTVMTTEVYRNIAWRSSANSTTADGGGSGDDLTRNAVVVLDEFHYMGNPGRGGVWEESVITSPSHTQIIALSATLSNAQALAAWMESVTGRTTILIDVPDTKRPVPLRYLFATKKGLYPLFRDPDAGPGAPKGLLGYRDATPVVSKPQKSKGFSKTIDAVSVQRKVPRGLTVNPILISDANRRLQKIDRAVERQKMRRSQGTWDDGPNGNWDEPSPRRQVYQNKRKLSAREERLERERLLKKEMRRAVPSLPALVNRLDQKDLLPAIFFIFSRAGCNNAALTVSRYLLGPKDANSMFQDETGQFGEETSRQQRRRTRQRSSRRTDLLRDPKGRAFRPSGDFVSDELLSNAFYDDEHGNEQVVDEDVDDDSPLAPENRMYYAKAGLLDRSQVEEVANRVAKFNRENEEIAFEDDLIESFLLGIGTHHAALLPAHKSFVEVLYQRQLMKVVFATETLAAGINMPARTTVICSMAKRGNGSSLNLLETSNLLQMAGRAGRRGKDTDGTCVIVATPFESHDEAAKILTDVIKPISSQFRPSYSLCVNLIARGEGELDVAKQLVGKSFAMWQESETDGAAGRSDSGLQTLSKREVFVKTLLDTLEKLVEQRSSKFDIARIQKFTEMIRSPKLLKENLKSFVALTEKLKLERTTLGYLEKEYEEAISSLQEVGESLEMNAILQEDVQEVQKQVVQQQNRLGFVERKLRKHPLSAIVLIASSLLKDTASRDGRLLSIALDAAQDSKNANDGRTELTALQLYSYLESIDMARISARDELVPQSPILESPENPSKDSWEEFMSITETLSTYGCIFENDDGLFQLSEAGIDIGMLGLENALWCVVAMGAAWDCKGASSRIDQLQTKLLKFDELGDPYENIGTDASQLTAPAEVPKAEQEAAELLMSLKRLSPAELAGYVSCLISDSSGDGGFALIEQLQRLSPLQRQAIQKAMLAMDRLAEVQRTTSDRSACVLDISNCEVVTAWAEGCSWSEALEISGSPPGDLARSLSRVLDALRQLGNLQYRPVRRDTDKPIPKLGIDPVVRKLCRDASHLINRYPLKEDSFASEDEEEDEEEEEEEYMEDDSKMST